MEYSIRPARGEDLDAIAEFTTDTFEWGDYIVAVFPDWLTDPNGRLIVCVDPDDRPIAVGRGVMLSDTEAWFQGFRVNALWRRKGLASAMVEWLLEWASDEGAKIARLLTEGWNEPAQQQVEKCGFRRSSDWIVGRRDIVAPEPVSSGNGGQRARARRKLELAHSSEAIPAWVSWRSGPLVRPARGLYVDGWRWSQLTAEHLEQAGKRGRLWTSQAGWVVTRRDGEAMYADWLECGEESIGDMIESILDLAAESHAELLRITVPHIDWIAEALDKAGFETSTMHLYEHSL